LCFEIYGFEGEEAVFLQGVKNAVGGGLMGQNLNKQKQTQKMGFCNQTFKTRRSEVAKIPEEKQRN
jgi:hypothetical protein